MGARELGIKGLGIWEVTDEPRGVRSLNITCESVDWQEIQSIKTAVLIRAFRGFSTPGEELPGVPGNPGCVILGGVEQICSMSEMRAAGTARLSSRLC